MFPFPFPWTRNPTVFLNWRLQRFLVGMAALAIALITYPIADYFLGNHLWNIPASVERARVLAMALYAYAKAHDGKYPTGASSTEVFQKLIDGHYLSDPGTVFDPALAAQGKIKATSKALTPQNVCWDVTVPADTRSPDALPLVFETGFRVTYAPHGTAEPLAPAMTGNGIVVCYCDLDAEHLKSGWNHNGIISDFVPASFDPRGAAYVQLTPNGPLP